MGGSKERGGETEGGVSYRDPDGNMVHPSRRGDPVSLAFWCDDDNVQDQNPKCRKCGKRKRFLGYQTADGGGPYSSLDTLPKGLRKYVTGAREDDGDLCPAGRHPRKANMFPNTRGTLTCRLCRRESSRKWREEKRAQGGDASDL